MIKIKIFKSPSDFGLEKDVNKFLAEKGYKNFEGYKLHYSTTADIKGSIKAYFTVLIEYEDN